MPPQPQEPGPENDANPNPYGFILDSQHPSEPKPRHPPSRLKKLAFMVGGGAVGLILLIILASVILGGGGASKDLISALARGQEITRVSTIAQPQLRDSDLQGLAATTIVSLTSQQAQISTYLKSTGSKIDQKTLAQYHNSKTDSDFKTAAINGNLATAYTQYLKQNLEAYAASLQAAYKNGSSKTKTTVAPALISAQTLLKSPQILSLK